MENRPLSGAYRATGRPTRDDRRETLRRKTVRHETSTAQLRRRRRDRRRLSSSARSPASSSCCRPASSGRSAWACRACSALRSAPGTGCTTGAACCHGRRAGPLGAALSLDRRHDTPYVRLAETPARAQTGGARPAPCDARLEPASRRDRPRRGSGAAAGRPLGKPRQHLPQRPLDLPGRFAQAPRPAPHHQAALLAGAAAGLGVAILGGGVSRGWAPWRPTPRRGPAARPGSGGTTTPSSSGSATQSSRRPGTVERRRDRQRRRRNAVERRPFRYGGRRRRLGSARRAARPRPSW